MDAAAALEIDYINPIPVAASLIIMLSLAPLFDLHAPALYIGFVQLLILIVLTFVFWKRLSPRELSGWCVFIILFLMLPVGRLLFSSIATQRWINLFINSASLLLGLYFLIHLKGNVENGSALLGLQNIVNNFVSGIILIFDRPLRIWDTVDIGDKRGRVKEIGVRSSTPANGRWRRSNYSEWRRTLPQYR